MAGVLEYCAGTKMEMKMEKARFILREEVRQLSPA